MKKKKQSIFWKIEGNHLSSPSYLLGTMHVIPKGKDDWMQPYLEKMELCEGFATEFNLAEIDMDLMKKNAQLPDNQFLSDFIPPRKLKKLERIITKILGVPLFALLKTKPLFIINMLTEKVLSENQSISMDTELFQMAQDMGKELSGIETFEEQLSVLNKIPLDYQVKNLLHIGKNIGNFRKNLRKMAAIYDEGNIQKIYKIAKKGTGGIKKLLLYDRNEIMANRIFEKTQTKSMFFALGAGHLSGKKGVLRLLKLKGIKVSIVKLKIEN